MVNTGFPPEPTARPAPAPPIRTSDDFRAWLAHAELVHRAQLRRIELLKRAVDAVFWLGGLAVFGMLAVATLRSLCS